MWDVDFYRVDPGALDQWDDRQADVRPLGVAAGYDSPDSRPNVRVHELSLGEESGLDDHSPGEESGLGDHTHDEPVPVFDFPREPSTSRPPGEFVVVPDQVLFVDPGSPQGASDPTDAGTNTRAFAIGAPSVGDARPYDPLDGA